MSDDLANTWGTDLVRLGREDLKEYRGDPPEQLQDELRRIVKSHFKNRFHVKHVVINGSTANVLAILDATDGDTSACLVAAGSYLCTSDYCMHRLATTTFTLKSNFSLVRSPDNNDDTYARLHIAALPYVLKGVMTDDEVELFENECFSKLHTTLIMHRLKQRPIKCLLLELMLAGSGAYLTDRALLILSKLCRKHNFNIVVDEIMTGARCCEHILYLQSKPNEFIECVSFVTLAKWLRVGVVLYSKKQHDQFKASTRKSAPSSTFVALNNVIPLFKKVTSQPAMAQLRREIVLNTIRLNPDLAWGEGCLIFGPFRHKTETGLKSRLLPLLESSRKIDSNVSIIIEKGNNVGEYKRKVHNANVMAIKEWLHLKIFNEEDDNILIDIINYVNQTHFDNGNNVKLDLEGLLKHVVTKTRAHYFLKKFESAGLTEYHRVGYKRTRTKTMSIDMIFHPNSI